MSRGRFLLGIGSSNPTIAKWHGLSLDHPLGRIQEYLEIVRQSVTGTKVSFEGEFFASQGFKMAFNPGDSPIPIYLAAFGPKMSRLAGRITDGVVINMANPSEIRRIAEEVRAGAREAGKDPDTLEVICKIRCSIAQSYESARDALSHVLTFYALADYYRDLFGRMGFAAEIESMRAAWKTGGFHAARSIIPDHLFDGLPLVAATAVDEIVEKMKPYRDAGVTRIIVAYVAASQDTAREMKDFIGAWS